MATPTTIVWLRQDLRLDDHPALAAAARRGRVIPLYIWAPHEEGDWSPAARGAQWWWLHQSLAALDADLRRLKSRLVIRKGDSLAVLREVVRESGADAVMWSRRYEPTIIARDTKIKASLKADGLTIETFNSALLYEPWEIKTKTGGPYQVFTPYWRMCLSLPQPPSPLDAPLKLGPVELPESLSLKALELEPAVNWAGTMRATWKPGERGAKAELGRFLDDRLSAYSAGRDLMGEAGTSRMSPYLHLGLISPRRIWHEVRQRAPRALQGASSGAGDYLRELGWREFAYHLLFHFPHTPSQPLRDAFASFRWSAPGDRLGAWQKGRTGYPVVDAAMRELWATGWMHNRARMIVGSFLVKDLLIDWLEGARWFWYTLIDADLASNTLGWQWVAGCGADAAPFFRVFNPVSQGQKFDGRGQYVRRWVPELARLPDKFIHCPFDAPPAVLRTAGVELGGTYPKPVVDHAEARERALEAYARISRPKKE